MGNCLRQAGQFRNDEKTYSSDFKATYQTFCTMTTPAAETKSMGLPADAHAVMVFATPPRQLYRDGTTSYRLPGFSTLTTSSGRENFLPSTGTLQKLMPSADTVGN